MEITFYCPDENFKLSGSLLQEKGVGGGKTALINLARALVKRGCKVKIVGFVEEGKYDGADYINKEKVKDIKTEVLVITTSQKLDLSELKEKKYSSKT